MTSLAAVSRSGPFLRMRLLQPGCCRLRGRVQPLAGMSQQRQQHGYHAAAAPAATERAGGAAHAGPGSGGAAQQQQQQQQRGVSSSPAVGSKDTILVEIDRQLPIPAEVLSEVKQQMGRVRVRQHVNPFRRELQVPTGPLEWGSDFEDSNRPLVVDAGCGYGRFLLALRKTMPQHNMLGLEIRQPIIERANRWAEALGEAQRVRFCLANATVSLQSMLESYPGAIDLLSVQFPDPHFKKRHQKRHTVQPQFVEAAARLLAPGARVFLQSDVLHAAEHMRDTFERHGGAAFAPCPDLHTPAATFHAASPLPEQQEQAASSGEEEGGSSSRDAPAAWQSQWAAAGWLQQNPLGVPTEREVASIEQGLPVYRVLLVRQ